MTSTDVVTRGSIYKILIVTHDSESLKEYLEGVIVYVHFIFVPHEF